MTRSVRMYDWPEPSGLTLIEGPALRPPRPARRCWSGSPEGFLIMIFGPGEKKVGLWESVTT